MNFISNFNPISLKDKLSIIRIEPDLQYLSNKQKEIINLLIKCGKIMDELFFIQKYPKYENLEKEIINLKDQIIYDYYKIMAGPFDFFNDNKSYIKGIKNNIRAGFYPEDLTKKEWEDFIKENHGNESMIENFTSPYSVIARREGDLINIPYSEFYKEKLIKASEFLIKASEECEYDDLKEYLIFQGKAFLNNDYYTADIKWIQLNNDNDIVPLVGAFEFYEDGFLGYKTSFSCCIGLKTKQEINKLSILEKNLDLLQNRLPIPEHYKKLERGNISKIEIVNLIYNSGEGRRPIPAIAFNLPNSQKIKSKYGCKKVLLYNIMKAKFDAIIMPISKLILNRSYHAKLNFSGHFNFILFHEISHELGIGFIKDNYGQKKQTSYFLREIYPVIEETKADVLGIYSLIYLIKNGMITDSSFIDISIIYLLNLIRSIRFGMQNAHGLASMIQLNYLLNDETFISDNNKMEFSINFHKFEKSIERLLTIILTLQGEGSYLKSREFINEFSKYTVIIDSYIKIIENLPVDIIPWYPLAGEKEPLQN